MKSNTVNGIQLFFFNSLARYICLVHAVSTRIGGISPQPFASLNLGLHTGDSFANITKNHTALCKALNVNIRSLVSSSQVHGSKIVYVDRQLQSKAACALQHAFKGYDAMVTDRPDVLLLIRVADCVPLILFDPAKKILALVHAGWKGTLAGIAAKTVDELANRFGSDPGDIRAGIGPSIGPCCYTVTEDIAQKFYRQTSYADNIVINNTAGAIRLNLWEANMLQLLGRGCRKSHIEVAGLCTSCNSHLFFSYRREKGKTGRFGLLAGLSF